MQKKRLSHISAQNHTHKLSLAQTLSLSLSLTYTHTHKHAHTHTHTHTHIGTYDIKDGTGGSNAAGMRFAPEVLVAINTVF
jgi:hypothetical protein